MTNQDLDGDLETTVESGDNHIIEVRAVRGANGSPAFVNPQVPIPFGLSL